MSRRIKNKLGYLTVALGIATMTFSPLVVYAQTPEDQIQIIQPYTNDPYEERTSLQPLGEGYSVEDVLNWSPEKDSDARYNRSAVPLQARYQGPVVNPNASAEAKIMNCALTYADTNNAPSQGSNNVNGYIFSYWQYIDSYVYWGSVDEGIFAIPTPDVVDSAHKNGVPVVGTVFFPWGQYNPEMIRDFCQQNPDGSFPVADKMLEIAEFYGFDGYFINQESSGANTQVAKQLTEMFMYMQEKNPDILLSWYDSMSSSGGISFQDQLSDGNSMYFQQGNRRVMDEFFLNYNWNKFKADTSVATAKKLGRSPFDVYAGLDVQENAYNTSFRINELLDESGKLRVSLAMYCPNSTLSMARDVVDFYKQDQTFWVGPTGDPSSSDTSKRWVGLANYVADKTPINQAFVTNFNLGHGYEYYIDGALSRDKEWSNRSVQDYLPTWRWIVESEGSKLVPDFDFTDAYNGGNSLKVTGNLQANAPNHIKLYSTSVEVTDSTDELEVVYKPDENGAKMQVGLCFEEDYKEENFKFFDVADGNAYSWNTAKIDLSDYKGESIKAISLRFTSDQDMSDYQINIGQIGIKDQDMVSQLPAPASITFDEIMLHNASNAELRMYWDNISNKDLAFYEIYRVKSNGEREFIGATPNNAYYIAPFDRYEDETKFNFEVVPVDKNYKRGDAQAITFDWTLNAEDTNKPSNIKPVNLALNKPVKTSRENSGEPGYKAVDGEVQNNSKWCATGASSGWLEVDLGEPQTVQRWVVTHAEAGGEANNMNTINFDLQVSYDGGATWENVDVVNNNHDAITDRALVEPVTAQHFRLNIRNSGSSAWSGIRIYEFELYESPTQLESDTHPMHFVKAINNEGALDTVSFVNVKQGQTVRLYKSLEEAEVWAEGEPDAEGKVNFTELDFGVEAGRVYYTVQDPNKEESVKLSAAYSAEYWEEAPIPTEFKFAKYDLKERLSSNQIYANLEIKGLQSGDVISYYTAETELVAKKVSMPVGKGETSTKLERLPLDLIGGNINLEIQREGMKPTRFNLAYGSEDTMPIKGSLTLNVRDTLNRSVQNAVYDVYKGQEKVAQLITNEEGIATLANIESGSYILKLATLPSEAYIASDTSYTFDVDYFDSISKNISLGLKVAEVADYTRTVKQFESFKLPETVAATLIDLSVVDLPVIWDKVANTTEPGIFEFYGAVENYDKQVKFTLEVVEEGPTQMNIKSVNHPADVLVEIGTVVEDIELPENIGVVLENDTEVELPVIWNTSTYNSEIPGTYTLTGEIVTSESITNAEGLKAKVNVIVQKAELKPEATLTMEGKIEEGVSSRVTYTVNLANLEDVNVYEVELAYDKDQLTITNAPLEIPAGVKIQTTNKPGKIKITFGTTDIKDLLESTPVISFDFKTSPSIKEGDKVKVELETVKAVSIDEQDQTTLHTIIGSVSDNEASGKPAGADINGDGAVTLEDLSIAMKYYMTDKNSTNWDKAKKCDINADGAIDLADLIAISAKRTDR